MPYHRVACLGSGFFGEVWLEGRQNEQPEIIPKPPSHPITTALLVASFAGTILCIGFVWAELFGSYLLGAKTPAEPGMEQHTWKEHKENREGMIDHYSQVATMLRLNGITPPSAQRRTTGRQ